MKNKVLKKYTNGEDINNFDASLFRPNIIIDSEKAPYIEEEII